jgi:hypothetical protein
VKILSKEKKLKDHMFELELDIVKFSDESDRVRLVGFLGDKLDIRYKDNILRMVGNEGSLLVHLDKEGYNGYNTEKK